jgi:hypothetical protein
MKMSQDTVQRVAILSVVAAAVVLTGCKRKHAGPTAWKSGTTIIPGTFSWNAETDSIGEDPQADLRWEQVSPAERYLAPINGAEAAIVKHRGYEQIDGSYLQRWHMPKERISACDTDGVLAPGAVIAFRTAEGTLGKLKIVGFRSPDAQGGDEPAGAARVEQRHLEIAWTLFQPQQP